MDSAASKPAAQNTSDTQYQALALQCQKLETEVQLWKVTCPSEHVIVCFSSLGLPFDLSCSVGYISVTSPSWVGIQHWWLVD